MCMEEFTDVELQVAHLLSDENTAPEEVEPLSVEDLPAPEGDLENG